MEKKKNKNKPIIVAVVIIISIYMIAFLGTYVSIKIAAYNSEKAQQESINKAKGEASKYLYNQYKKNFNLELSSEGYKANEISIDGSTGRCGHDKNIRQYVFIVSQDNLPIKTYVTVWKNIETDEIEIEEVNGEESNTESTSYEWASKIYNQKMEIKEELEKILNDNYKDYTINYNYDYEKETDYETIFKYIKIELNHSMKDELENNMQNINSIIELLKDKNIYIIIEFNDATRTYHRNSNIEKEKEKEGELAIFANDVYKYLEANYEGKYSVNGIYERYLTISIPVNIKTEYYGKNKAKYEILFNDLHYIAVSNDKIIELDFYDYTVNIGRYYSDSLEEESKKWD